MDGQPAPGATDPAVTVGRAFGDTFAGIEPASVSGFVAARLVGDALGPAPTTVLFGRATDRSA